MLRILSINPTGFGPYGYHSDVAINDQGVVWLTGQNLDKGGSNASGKSSFFNVISHCLWGRVETVVGQSFSSSDEISNEAMGLGSCPRVVFSDASAVVWRVTVSRKWKAPKQQPSPYLQDSELWPFKGSDIFLERWDGTKWLDERKATVAKTREYLRGVVGISYERYLVTTYLAQGQGLDFLRGTHAQRMSIFTDICDLGLWDGAAGAFKVSMSEALKLEQDCALTLARLQGEASSIWGILTDEQIANYHQQLTDFSKREYECNELKRNHELRITELSEQIGSISVGVNPYVGQLRDFDVEAKAEGFSLNQQLQEARAAIEKEQQATRTALAAIKMRTSSTVQSAQAKLYVAEVALKKAQATMADFLSGKLTHCPTCRQELPNKVDDAHVRGDLDSCKAEYQALLELLKEEQAKHAEAIESALKKEEADSNVRVAALQETLARVAATVEARQQELKIARDGLEAQVGAFYTSEATKAQLVQDLRAQQQTTRDLILKVEVELTQIQSSRSKISDALSMSDYAKERRAQVALKVTAAEKDLASAKLDTAEWTWLAKNVGDKGMKAYKLEVICTRLNELIADALGDIDSSFRLWVAPYRVKPSAEGKAADQLTSEDIVNEVTMFVQEGVKRAVPLYMYSGGEVSIISLVLLVALWRLAEEQGSGTNLLLLDEVVGFLDARNSQIVVRFLEGLKAAGKTVVTVSHSQVVDSVDFDAVWTVSKKNGISVLEV